MNRNGNHHKPSEETKEKMRQAKIGRKLSEEHKRKIGEWTRLHPATPETRAKMVANRRANGNYVFSAEQIEKLCVARRKRVITPETRAKLGRTTKGHKYALGYHHTEETKEQMSKVRKIQWQDPEFRAKTSKNKWKALLIHPNKPETIILRLLDIIAPNEWAFVGDGSVLIQGYSPDFINKNGQKKIIELFGDYWHGKRARTYEETEEGRKTLFAKYGYQTLVIWESELKNIETTKDKIAGFCNVGLDK